MAPKLTDHAINNGDINLMDAYSTDADLRRYDMVILEDDQKVFPPYQGAPLFTQEFLDEHPEIIDPLNKLRGQIRDSGMKEMANKTGHEAADTSPALAPPPRLPVVC